MARTAIISDIHANLEGLQAVLADIDKRGIQEVLCLGDIVGYGPNPIECVDLVRQRCKLVIRGNHDDALLHGPVGFTTLAREAIDWTRKQMRPRLWRRAARDRWHWLEELPAQATWQGYLLVHGSPRDPISEYIMDREVVMGDPQKFVEIFAKVETVCFVGHTHIPGIFLDGPSWVAERDLRGPFGYEGRKMVVNVGSVGQPRDRNPDSCYVTVDAAAGLFEFHRVPYDHTTTRKKIHAISELNPQLGDRLADGN